MAQVEVELGDRSYPVVIETKLDASKLLEAIGERRAFIISDTHVASLYLNKVKTMLAERAIGAYVIAAGEASKSLEQTEAVIGEMMGVGADRKSIVIALGGGVVGDLAGFVASTYMRGIDFIQIPTTILAMVDSSVGGKVAVNHPLGKNIIGHFHQPIAVFIATDMLKTLPAREVSAGIAEVIKYGVIWDEAFFTWLELHLDELMALKHEVLIEAIQVSVKTKAEIVSKDEREGGLRAILNFGHTFAHAEELLSGYGEILHGEAVGAGMVAACVLSQALGKMSPAETQRVTCLIQRAKLPSRLSTSLQKDNFWLAMQGDKKSHAGVVNFVLAPKLGQCEMPQMVERALVERMLAESY